MTDRAPRRGVVAGVVALTALALALGFAYLARKSFWLDEAFTWSTVDRPFPDLLELLLTREGFQILHSLVVWPVNQISSDPVAFRLPSVLAYAASIPAAWLAGRNLFDDRAGLGAALLLAVNALAVQYAQEARSYTLAMMFVTYAGAFLAGEVRAPSARGRTWWVGASALAVYAHGMALFPVVGQVGSLLLLPRTGERRRLLRGGVAIGLAVLPAVLLAFLHEGSADDRSWIEKPSLGSLASLLWILVGRTFTMVPVYLLAGAVVVAAMWPSLRRVRPSFDLWRFAMPLAWFAFPVVSLLAISMVSPVFVYRYAVPGLAGLAVLGGYGLTRLRRPVLLGAVIAATLALAMRGVTQWYSFEWGMAAAAWDELDVLVADLDRRAESGDAVVVVIDAAWLPFEYASRGTDLPERLVPVYPTARWGGFATGDQSSGGDAFGEQEIEQVLTEGYERLWIVAAYHTTGEVDPRVNQLLGAYDVTSHTYYGVHEELLLLEHR